MQSKKIKRLILFMLLFSLTAIPLYGCSSNNSEQAAEKSEFKDGKFNPPVTINYVREVGNEIMFRDGETINDNVHTRWAKDELGIIINHPWTTPGGSDQFSQKIRLSLSANEELPDVMMVNGTLLTDLVDSGKFLSIDEAIDQFASDRLKALYKQFPESFYSAMKDGKRYGLPVFSGGNGSDPVMWIRQDWLDKLQMKAPTTLAELEQLMDAFVNKDPDGNNKKDTVALAIGSSIASWIADSSFLWGALGSHGLPFRWYENSEGKLQYGSIVPETKAALGKLKEWTDKGYVDKDFMINDSGKAAERFTAGNEGIIFGPAWMVGWPNPDVLKNVPSAVLKPYPIVSGPNGEIGRTGEGLTVGYFVFNKNFKHMDAFFRYLDALYGFQYGDEKYFKNGWYEGYDFVIKPDGSVSYDDKDIPGGKLDPSKYAMTRNAPDIPFKAYDTMKKLSDGLEPITVFEKQLATSVNVDREAATITTDQNKYRIADMFTGSPTTTMKSKKQFLDKMEQEVIAKIVLGKSPLDDFDKFVEEWKSGGGDDITNEVNEWYKSIKK